MPIDDPFRARLLDSGNPEWKALREALEGRFEPLHALLIGAILAHIDFLDEAIERLSAEIEEQMSRYLLVKPLFDLYAGYRYQATGKQSENALGNDQESFVRDRLQNSDRTFKVLVSSTSLTSMILDLRSQTALPATLQQQFYLDCDQWDGFPSKRAELFAFLTQANVKNALFVCGDIHAGFVSKVNAGAGNDLPVITSPAISSQTLKEELLSQVEELGLGAAAAALVNNLEPLLQASNPQILFNATDKHGFTVVEITGQGAKATLHQIPNGEVAHDYSTTPGDLAGKFTTRDVAPGQLDLRRLRLHGGSRQYLHEEVGTNSRLDTLQAAVLLAKLPYLQGWNEARKRNAARYTAAFSGHPAICPPTADPANAHIYHQYTLRVPQRDQLQAHLKANGIGHAVYYPLALHLQPCFAHLGYRRGSLPVSEAAMDSVISLPIYPEMTVEQQDRVIETVQSFYA